MQKKQALRRARPYQTGTFEKHGRFWAVTDAAGRLVCLAVYKKGAAEVLRRLVLTTRRQTHAKRKQRGD